MENKLFDITEEQAEVSRKLFGRIVKCIVAPNHTYDQMIEMVSNKNVHIFPERDISKTKAREFINDNLEKEKGEKSTNDILIITSETSIITDIPGELVRVMDLKNELHMCPIKTFHANIIDVEMDLFRNSNFTDTDESKEFRTNQMEKIIEKVQEVKTEKRKLLPKEREGIKLVLDILGDDYLLASFNEYTKNVM